MSSSSGVLTVDLGAIARNYQTLRRMIGPQCRIGGVVKANAYGLGAVPVAETLIAQGCRALFVATPEEGLALRNRFADVRILILNGFYKSAQALYLENNFIPVLGSLSEIRGYAALARENARELPIFLNFNTGMNRLGLSAAEARKILDDQEMLSGLAVKGVMSHFACADEPKHPLIEIQYDAFSKISALFPQAERSLCNSAGIFLGSRYHCDIVRPGMALYGLNPTPGLSNPLVPAVSLKIPVLKIWSAAKGESTGYGATYRFDDETALATLSAGYADGLFRSLSNRGCLYWRGHACPIRGRVSMDLTVVDLSAVPEAERPYPGDFLELIGPHQSADDLAEKAGTIGYEILTSLGRRYRTEYVKALAPLASADAA